MFTSLRLQNFKNFKDATLKLGPLTVLVGANASGKSNIRDAFRFLHGIGREYSLPQIFGEIWNDSGEKVWTGIRGGFAEVIRYYNDRFRLEVSFDKMRYEVEVGLHGEAQGRSGIARPMPASERLLVDCDNGKKNEKLVFESQYRNDTSAKIAIRIFDSKGRQVDREYLPSHSALHQVSNDIVGLSEAFGGNNVLVSPLIDSQVVLLTFGRIRFHEGFPESMRRPSVPGVEYFGDHGENLSSVLYAICQDAALKAAVLEWIRQLTPLDLIDFDFSVGADGKILLMLVESDGSKTSALSASDGTLRFLAMIAALFGPKASKFYFIEELDNGIHPTRLGLLLDLIESRAREAGIQVVATTHSPQLLAMLSPEAREYASLVYRREGERDGHIIPILDLPHAREVTMKQSLGRLHESGWLENVVAFMDNGALPK